MFWIELVLAALKTINAIMEWIGREKWMKAGRDQVLAEIALDIAKKVQTKKQLWEKIDAMDEATVDRELRDLEPK